MKKLLLSLVCFLICFGMAKAETVTFDFTSNDYGLPNDGNTFVTTPKEITDGDITVVLKGDTEAWRYWSDGLRIYYKKNPTITISTSVGKVTDVSWTVNSGVKFSATSGGTVLTNWSGNESSITLYGDVGTGNAALKTLTITYSEETGGGNTGGGTTEPEQPSNPGATGEATFDFTKNSYGLPNDNNTYVTTPTTISEGLVELTLEGNNTSSWRYWSDGLRIYYKQNPSFTVSVPGGKITEITWTTAASTVKFTDVVSNGSAINSWSGNAESVTLYGYVSTANAAVKTITVKYEGGEAPAVATPTFSCTDNIVTISCATDGADIYYTLDGNTPTQSSAKYSNPFAITQNLTVKAIAYKDGVASAIGTYNAIYVGNYNGFEALVNEGANAEGTVDGPITAIYQNGLYLYVVDNLGYPMLVYGTVNQNLTNGQTISEISGKYSPYSGLPELTNPTLGTIGTGTAISPQNVNDAVNNDMINRYVKFENVTIDATNNMTYGNNTIVLYKRFNDVTFPTDYTKNYNVTGFVSIFNGTLQIYPTEFEEVTVVNQVATPVFSPDGGAVNSGDEVEITCDTPSASIYYTLDGSDPTQDSNLYNAPIAITEAVTIKAIAVKEGMTDSYVSTADFTVINPSAKDVMFNFAAPSTLNSEYKDEGENTNEVDVTDQTFTNGPISISFAAADGASNNPRLYYGTGSAAGWTLRFYKDNTITIKAAENYRITSIDFVATNLGNSSITWSAGSFSSNIWTSPTSSTIQLMSDDDDDVKELVIGKTESGNNPTITSMTVHYDFATGVESIEAVDNGEAVYYNLQGVKVNNPERGLFIKVQNGKATKVVK